MTHKDSICIVNANIIKGFIDMKRSHAQTMSNLPVPVSIKESRHPEREEEQSFSKGQGSDQFHMDC